MCVIVWQCKNEEEVVAVIAHELGHWKLSHTMYSFLAMQVEILFLLSFCVFVSVWEELTHAKIIISFFVVYFSVGIVSIVVLIKRFDQTRQS